MEAIAKYGGNSKREQKVEPIFDEDLGSGHFIYFGGGQNMEANLSSSSVFAKKQTMVFCYIYKYEHQKHFFKVKLGIIFFVEKLSTVPHRNQTSILLEKKTVANLREDLERTEYALQVILQAVTKMNIRHMILKANGCWRIVLTLSDTHNKRNWLSEELCYYIL